MTVRRSLLRIIPGIILLLLSACNNPPTSLETTLPLLGSGLTPQPVTAQGSVEFDDIIDVEDTGHLPAVPAQVGTRANTIGSLDVDYSMIYISSTAPDQELCLSLGWFAVWGQASASELFGDPTHLRLTIPLTFVPQGADQWKAMGSYPASTKEIQALQAWLNSRPTTSDNATVGGRGQLVRCSDQSADSADFTGVLSINTFLARITILPSLQGRVPAPILP